MYKNLKDNFERLVNNPDFQILVREYRYRFGIPESGFGDIKSQEYKIWVKEDIKKSTLLNDQFFFIAKKCKNLISTQDPSSYVLLEHNLYIFKKAML